MIETKQYKCEICGETRNDKSECAKCEGYHVKATKIISERFLPMKVGNVPYPQQIVLEMADGKRVMYTHDGTHRA